MPKIWFGHDFWLEGQIDLRTTRLNYILQDLFRDTPLGAAKYTCLQKIKVEIQKMKYVKLGRLAFRRAMSAVHLRGSWHWAFPSASPRFHWSAKKNRRQGHFIKQSNVAHPNKVITCILDKSSHPYLSVKRFFYLNSCFRLLIHCSDVQPCKILYT